MNYIVHWNDGTISEIEGNYMTCNDGGAVIYADHCVTSDIVAIISLKNAKFITRSEKRTVQDIGTLYIARNKLPGR